MNDKPSLKNCSPKKICSALRRLCGIQCVGGGKHNFKLKHPKLTRPFPLPNRVPLNPNIVEGIVQDVLIDILHIPEEEIYKEIRC